MEESCHACPASFGRVVDRRDGRWLAFHKLTPAPGGRSSSSVLRTDGSGAELDLAFQPDPPTGGFDNGPVWAPDSSAILVSRMGSMTNPAESTRHAYLEVLGLDGTRRVPDEEASGSIGWPDWSPDGTWIVYGVGPQYRRPVLIHPDGTGRTELPSDVRPGDLDCGVHWAPDGASLVLACDDFVRFDLADLGHPVPLAVTPGAIGWDWQRRARR